MSPTPIMSATPMLAPGLEAPLGSYPPAMLPGHPEAMPMPVGPGSAWNAGPCLSSGVRYWIVSSRCAPQHVGQAGCHGLQVYECGCDGCVRPSSCQGLVSQLQPGAPVMLYMHGAYVTWESNLEQAADTWQWIRCVCPERPLNIIFYTWPSDQTRVLLAPCELKQQGVIAENNAFYVASLLRCIPACHPVCLIGHSFGARMALATVQLLAGGAIQGRSLGCAAGQRRVRVVLAAAAVDHNWLNDCQRYNLAPCYAEGILNLYNRQDCALKFYPLLRLFSRRALGSIGQTRIDDNRQSCPEKVHNCNVTGLVGHGHFWPNYYQSRQIARIIAPWVYFPESTPAAHGAMSAAESEERAAESPHRDSALADDRERRRLAAPPVAVASHSVAAPAHESLPAAAAPAYRPLRAWLASP